MLISPYGVHIFIGVFIAYIVASGVGWLLYTGVVSMCHAALLLVGSYASALLVMHFGLSFWLAMPITALITAIVGILLILPSFKLSGLYFMLMTLAVNEIVRLGILNGPGILGGHTGMTAVPRPNPIVIPGIVGVDFTTKASFYYLVLGIALSALFVGHRIYTSHFGRVLRLIKEVSEIGAECRSEYRKI